MIGAILDPTGATEPRFLAFWSSFWPNFREKFQTGMTAYSNFWREIFFMVISFEQSFTLKNLDSFFDKDSKNISSYLVWQIVQKI